MSRQLKNTIVCILQFINHTSIVLDEKLHGLGNLHSSPLQIHCM